MIECPSCGAENRSHASFCMFCGMKLQKLVSKDTTDSLTVPTLSSGAVLGGRYEIEELINTGGMGYVYRGKDRQSGKTVAIKEMMDRFTSRQERKEAIERFNREADILCRLQHQSIPDYIEYFVEKKRYYLVMEYIEGQDLGSTMRLLQSKDQLIPMENIVRWALKICEVLDFLHSLSPPVIYRDLKPSNVMISSKGEMKLIDFGIARLFTPKVKATMVGTQGYAPPEQYRGESEPRSDLYSLGATLHHLLTGKDPQYEAPFHFPPVRKLNPAIPISLEIIIDKALRLVPGDRFQNAREFRSALSQMIATEEEFLSLDSEIKDISREISHLKVEKTKLVLPGEYLKYQKEQGLVDGLTPQHREITGEWNHFLCNPQRTGLSDIASRLRGTVSWRKKAGDRISASPVIDSKSNIYVGVEEGYYFSMNSEGNINWKYDTKNTIIASSALFSKSNKSVLLSKEGMGFKITSDGEREFKIRIGEQVQASPLIGHNRIYFGDIRGFFHCIDSSGEVCWIYDTTAPIYSAAALDNSEETIYISNNSGKLFAMSIEGDVEWSVTLSSGISASPSVSSEGIIYVACDDGFLYAVDSSGEILWRIKTGGPIYSSPAIGKDGTVFFTSYDGFLHAADEEGIEKWSFNAEDELITSPVVTDDGSIYFVSEDGFLFSLNYWGKTRWWLDLGSKVVSPPAIGPQGKLYVCTENGFVNSIE